MRRELPQRDNIVSESKYIGAYIFIAIIVSVLVIRLWHIQVFKGPYYEKVAQYNLTRKIDIPAPRGNIYDRNGQLLLGNRSSHNLVFIPQYVKDETKILSKVSHLLNVPISELQSRRARNSNQALYLPIILKRDLSQHEVALIQTHILDLPGIDIQNAPHRKYLLSGSAHLLGYLGEINAEQLKNFNDLYPEKKYQMGDLVGNYGLEKVLEPHLKGTDGFRYIQVDAFGRKSNFENVILPNLENKPAKQGSEVLLTIDADLQRATSSAFKGKNGAVIAMDPRSGEILSIVSEPQFDLNIFQKGITRSTWRSLISNPYKPLLDKTTGGIYPPGSIYKALVAMAALEEGLITPNTKHECNGSLTLGKDTFHCHKREGHGNIDLYQALKYSCDVYFYNIGLELSVDTLEKYASDFGLGSRLELGLNMESPGIIPSTSWKKKQLKVPWTTGETLPIVIGQGYNAMTPLQMATLYAGIANGGEIWRPHIIQSIIDYTGKVIKKVTPELLRSTTRISDKTYSVIKSALKSVVMSEDGTGRRAQVEGYEVAGKTGTVQVVKMDKFTAHENVSSQWREHAVFAAFSPVNDPEIVVLVLSENDKVGGGGAAAAPIAQEIISTFFKLKQRKQLSLRPSPKKMAEPIEGNRLHGL